MCYYLSSTSNMSCRILLDYSDCSEYNNSDHQTKGQPQSSNNQKNNNNYFSLPFEGRSNNNNNIKRNYLNSYSGPTCLNFLSLISRTVYLRRLRFIKFYMAFMISILILFLLFHNNGPSSQEHTTAQKLFVDQLMNNSSISSPRPTTQSLNNDNNNQQETIINTKKLSFNNKDYNIKDLITTTPKRPIILDPTRYSNNATFKLDIRDFIRAKPNVMQIKIREAMRHSWNSYRQYSWGYDMLKPRAKAPDHWFNLGLTIVDGADTLIMMGLQNEAGQAIDWIENELKFDSHNANSNCFELTIRILAGLLSTYHLSGREKIKDQATKMGDILLHCYDTESKIVPYSDIDLSTNHAHPPTWNPHSSLSEVASIQLEFRYLSQITKNPIYEDTTFETNILLHNLTSTRTLKLLPMYINPRTSRLEESIITLGARADSYYEYLLKQYMQTGIKWLEHDYLDSVDAMATYLFRHTNGMKNYTYIAEMDYSSDKENIRYTNKMDHLVCFLPGTLALGYYHYSPLAAELRLKHLLETPSHKLNSRYDAHLRMAQDLARTCFHMYSDMGTGLAPEIANFVHSQNPDDPLTTSQPELQVSSQSAHNILRPEFVESLFYLYHITGYNVYRLQGEMVFNAFEKYCRIPSGYTPISDVRQKPTDDRQIEQLQNGAPDRMESFWLSETLKYLYLLFCDDRHIVGTLLNNYVFNTEGHIMPIL